MTEPTASVTVEITGGLSIVVSWSDGMSAQAALELAWNQINSTKKFTYGLQYYGTSLGYMVFMVNETFDSFLSEAEPYFYWDSWSIALLKTRASTAPFSLRARQ